MYRISNCCILSAGEESAKEDSSVSTPHKLYFAPTSLMDFALGHAEVDEDMNWKLIKDLMPIMMRVFGTLVYSLAAFQHLWNIESKNGFK